MDFIKKILDTVPGKIIAVIVLLLVFGLLIVLIYPFFDTEESDILPDSTIETTVSQEEWMEEHTGILMNIQDGFVFIGSDDLEDMYVAPFVCGFNDETVIQDSTVEDETRIISVKDLSVGDTVRAVVSARTLGEDSQYRECSELIRTALYDTESDPLSILDSDPVVTP